MPKLRRSSPRNPVSSRARAWGLAALGLTLLALPAQAARTAGNERAFVSQVEAALHSNLPDTAVESLLSDAEQRLLQAPKNAEYAQAVGLLHARLRHWENAVLQLSRLARPSAEALAALARCYYELGEYRRAAEVMARSGDPARARDTWQLYCLSLQNAGRRAEAAAQWERFRQHYPIPLEGLEFLRDEYRKPGAGHAEKARLVLEDLIHLKAGSPDLPALWLEAAALYPPTDAHAVEYRQRYLRVHPEDRAVWRDVAGCYAAQKNTALAAEAYQKAVPGYFNDGAFLFQAAAAVAAVNPTAGAVLYAQCLPLLPHDPRPALELGKLREALHQPDSALAAYAEALRRAPGLDEAKDRLAALAGASKDPGAWLPPLVAAEKKNPRDDALQFRIAKLYLAGGDTAQAYEYLNRALRNRPDRREYTALLPSVITQEAQIARHFAALEALHRGGENSPELLALLCRGYSLFKKPALAVEAAQELLRRDPVRLARIRSAPFDAQAVKNAPLTLQLCDNYLAGHPNDVEVRRLQVETASALGAPVEAQRRDIAALMSQDPTADEWLLRLAKLDLQARDSTAAFTHADAWTHIHPDDPDGQEMVRVLAKNHKDRQDAYLASLDRLSRLDTARHAEFEMDIAAHYLASGDAGKAVEIMGQLAPQLPNDAAFWHRYGMALQQLGRDAAPEALEKAWRLEPGNSQYALDFARGLRGDSALAANVPVLRLALQRDPQSLPLQLAYAHACYLAGDVGASAAAWRAVEPRDPAAAAEDSTAALAFLKTGRPDLAARLLEAHTAKDPHDLRALSLLADLYARAGKRADQTQVLEKLVQEDYGYGDYLLRLAREQEAAGRHADATHNYSLWCFRHPEDRVALKEYHDAAEASRDSVSLLDALHLLTQFPDADRAYRFQQAEIFYLRGGDPAELERLVKDNPDYREGRILLVQEYHSKGDFKNLARFQGFLEQETQSSSDLLEPLADLQAAQEKWDAADKTYFTWLGVHPKDAEVYAKVLRLAQEHQSPYLVSILRMGLAQHPEDTKLQTAYAQALGKTAGALPVYQALLQKKPDDVNLLKPAAEIARSLGRKDLAIPWYQAWAKADPDDPDAWHGLIALYDPVRDRARLADALAGLHRLDPNDRDLSLRLGQTYEALGQWDYALDAYQGALYVDPTNKSIRDKVIALLRTHASKETATDMLTEIQTLDHGAHEAQYELARLYVQRGDREKAYAYLIAALEQSPHNPVYLALLPHTIQGQTQILKHFDALVNLAKNPALNRRDTANVDLLFELGQGYALKQQWDAATRNYALVDALRPELLYGNRDVLVTCFKGKNWPLVADLSVRYFKLHPDFDKEILQMQVMAYQNTGKSDDAIRGVLEQLLTLDEDDAGALLRLAELDLHARDTASTLQHLRACLMTHPNELRAYSMMLPLVDNRPDEVATYLVTLEKIALLDSTRRIDCWERLANLYEGHKNYREAHRLLSRLVRVRPKDPTLWFRLGKMRAELQLGDMGTAMFRRAWELEPQNLTYARTYAQTLRTRPEIAARLDLFRFLDAHAPLPQETHGLAIGLFYHGDYPASAAAWDRFFARQPDARTDVEIEAAQAYWRTGQWAKALPFYEMRLEHTLRPLYVLDTLEALYAHVGNEDKRVKALQHLVQLDPTYKDFQLQLAQAREKHGQPAVAVDLYGQWTARHPRDLPPLLSMRRLADSLRDTAALETALRDLVQLPKPQAAHICQLAELDYLQTGALEPLEHAVKIDPAFRRGKLILAREYYRRDEVPKLAAFEPELVAASATDPDLLELRADLYAYQNKAGAANTCYLNFLRHRRDVARSGDEAARAAFHDALEKSWSYAQATSASTLPELLELGNQVFPNDPRIAHALGSALGNTPKAVAFDAQWLAQHPEDAEMLPDAAETAGHLQDWPHARDWYGKWAEAQPANLPAWQGLLTAAEKLGDAPNQLRALQALADLQPDNAAASFALGSALVRQGEYERALEYLGPAADMQPGDKTYARAAQNALETLAESALKAGDRAKAAEWYAILLQRDPGHPKASLYVGLADAESQDFADAAPLLRKGLAQSTEPAAVRAEGYRDLGLCASALGNAEAAHASFVQALSLNPEDSVAAADNLDAVQTLNRLADLPSAYAAVIRTDSNNVDALGGLAGLRLAAGQNAEAVRLLRRLASLRPNDAAVFAQYGEALLALNRNDVALTALTKAYDLGDLRPEVVGDLVRLHRQAGTLDQAMPVLEEWLRQSPNDTAAAAFGAQLAERRRDWRQAEEMWALAVQAAPAQVAYNEGLARVYERLGEYQAAADLLEPQGAKLSGAGWVLLGDAYAATPDPDKALAAYRKAETAGAARAAVAAELRIDVAQKNVVAAQRLLAAHPETAGDPEVTAEQVHLDLLQHDLEKALALAQGMATAHPREARAQALRGEVLLARHQGAEALQACSDAAQLDTTLWAATQCTGMADLQLDRAEEARTVFFALGEKSDPHARALGLWGLGEVARHAGHEADAKDYWVQSLSLAPTAQGFADLSHLCLRLKQIEDAEVYAQRALEINSDFPDGIAALSETMVARSQEKDALDYVQDALRKNPGSCDLQREANQIQLERGDVQALAQSSDQARQVCPDDPMAWYYAGIAAAKTNDSKDAASHFAHYKALGGDPEKVPQGF